MMSILKGIGLVQDPNLEGTKKAIRIDNRFCIAPSVMTKLKQAKNSKEIEAALVGIDVIDLSEAFSNKMELHDVLFGPSTAGDDGGRAIHLSVGSLDIPPLPVTISAAGYDGTRKTNGSVGNKR